MSSSWFDAFQPLTVVYVPERSWWFVIMALRRFLLVVVVAFTPYDSPVLPLLLFAVIQGSAVLQHRWQPYGSPTDNIAELLSLYLLLINYFSSSVADLEVWVFNREELVAWFDVLLFLNITFVVLLGLRLTFELFVRCSVKCKPRSAMKVNEGGLDLADDDDDRTTPLMRSP